MARGGKRIGAGRPTIPKEKQAKTYSFRLYAWELEKVKEFIKQLRNAAK